MMDLRKSKRFLGGFGNLDYLGDYLAGQYEKLSKVMEMMQGSKQRVYPVMEDNQLKGILNFAGLHRFIAVKSALNL
jgi:hypothetical protein